MVSLVNYDWSNLTEQPRELGKGSLLVGPAHKGGRVSASCTPWPQRLRKWRSKESNIGSQGAKYVWRVLLEAKRAGFSLGFLCF